MTIIKERVTLGDATIIFYTNGAVRVSRSNGSSEYLNKRDIETILEHYNV